MVVPPQRHMFCSVVRSLLVAVSLMGLVSGCAVAPREELGGAQRIVARAYSLGADHLATQHYQKAYEALKRGEALLNAGEYEQARSAFAIADHFARVSIQAAQEEQDRLEKELKAREEAERRRQLEASQEKAATSPAPPKSAQKARAPETRPAPEPPPEPEPEKVSRYDVQEGDTLWLISIRPEVYGDPLLWPVLYRANRDQIKDPRRVYEGQTLEVPRNMTEAELEEAREQARQSEIFPIGQLLPQSSNK
ncbi:MAG: LysM peptidoglycan-binding domain-containing protein [Thermodesulfobacteriota bacterium]|nr:LysM peptidoglycan-binding domain-containing protein [Thermodesulfobacteriota bacterium]